MAELAHVNFACPDPDELADFWAAALEGERRGWLDSVGLEVVDVPTAPRSRSTRCRGGPTAIPIHVDLHADDREAEVERLRNLGATVREEKSTEEHGEPFRWTVLEDPAGNGFCVSEGE